MASDRSAQRALLAGRRPARTVRGGSAAALPSTRTGGGFRAVLVSVVGSNGEQLESPCTLGGCDSLRSSLRSLRSLRCGACFVSLAERTAPFGPTRWFDRQTYEHRRSGESESTTCFHERHGTDPARARAPYLDGEGHERDARPVRELVEVRHALDLAVLGLASGSRPMLESTSSASPRVTDRHITASTEPGRGITVVPGARVLHSLRDALSATRGCEPEPGRTIGRRTIPRSTGGEVWTLRSTRRRWQRSTRPSRHERRRWSSSSPI